MSGSEISKLPEIVGADLDDVDEFVVVHKADTSRAPSGRDYKITKDELSSVMGGGGESGLGKLVEVGYNGLPTYIDPAADDWADVVANDFPWVQFAFNGSNVQITSGAGAGTAYTSLFSSANATEVYITDGTGYVDFFSSVTPAQSGINVQASAGQTLSFLNLGSVFEVKPDGSVGGVTPNTGDVLSWDGSKIVWTTL